MLNLIANNDVRSAFGQIEAPEAVARYDTAAGGIGLLLFFSNVFQLATVIAGLWVLLNFVLAGFHYITGQGDSGAHKKVREQITNSIIGLIIIVVSYTIVALLGLLFFGNAAYFLNPELRGPGG